MPDIQDVAASDIRTPNLTIDSIRSWAIYNVITQNSHVLNTKGDSRLHGLLSLRQSIIGLQELFAVHYSSNFLSEVKTIEANLDALFPEIANVEVGSLYARGLMRWFGLIAEYLLPGEGVGEMKTGIMRFGFYEDQFLLEVEEKERKKLEEAKKQFKEQTDEGKKPSEVVINVK